MMSLGGSGGMLPRKLFENLIAIYIMSLQLKCFFSDFLTKISLKFFPLIVSLIQQYCGVPKNAPLPPTGGSNFGDVLIRHCPPRFKKHAKDITIYLQCLNRRNGKDAAVQLFWVNKF